MFQHLKAKIRGCKRSLTIWFNSAMATAVVLLPVAQDQFPQMQAFLSEDLYRVTMGLIVAINILLRFKTTADLAHKGPSE